MKSIYLMILFIAVMLLLVDCASSSDTPTPTPMASNVSSVAAMTAELTVTDAPAAVFSVSSPGIVDGYIDSAYGMHGTSFENGIPKLSIPIVISNTPADTACYALIMDDPDSEPLCGYAWIHWMASNFIQTSLPEGISATADSSVVQGKNDSGTIGYAGPTPPDKDHTYRITVYALDAPLDLQSGFSREQFTAALEGHVLAEVTLEGIYRK